MFVKRIKKILKLLFIDKPLTPKQIDSILVKDIRTDELKADMIYDYPAKLSELLKKEA